MEDLVELLVPFLVAAPFVALGWFLRKRSGRQSSHPLWPAFNATAGAAVFIWAGTAGYNLNALDANAAGTPWAGTVIWVEVGIGLALVPVAIHYWRRGLRSLQPAPAPTAGESA